MTNVTPGNKVSGGALALEQLCATRNQPECGFFLFLDIRAHIRAQCSAVRIRLVKILLVGANPYGFRDSPYGIWLTASGKRRIRG